MHTSHLTRRRSGWRGCRPGGRAWAIAAQLKPKLDGASARFPAVLRPEHNAEAWRDLSDRLGVPAFEIPTLPPSVPGMRLYNAFRAALTHAGVPILLDMTAVSVSLKPSSDRHRCA